MDSPTNIEPESNVTVALVERVADRLITGASLSLALAGEGVSCGEYEEYLRRHPELADRVGVAKLKFLQNLIKILLDSKNASANVRWLLERLYPDAFDRRGESGGVTVDVCSSTVTGMSEEYVRALQEGGKRL